MGRAGRGREGGALARQHEGGAALDNEAMRRLIQEAVDEALAAIARGERAVGPLAGGVGQRQGARGAEALARALEDRLAEVEQRLAAVDERHQRAEQRLDEVAQHAGHREPLEMGKVPPEVLERSFQTALDELCGEIAKAKGRGEAERLLDEALVDIRGRSAGAELFERSEERIVIRGLAQAVARRLLSAKAAQATFDELARHLRLHVPSYRPRSLPALIKTRAAEFAVDSAVRHRDRLASTEAALDRLLVETRRIEAEAKDADAKAGQSVSHSFMRALAERQEIVEELRGRLQALEKRAAQAEGQLEKALARLDSVERYASRVESAVIRRTKEGTMKGDFVPVIDAVHHALAGGKARTVGEIAKGVKGVDREVVEAVVREGIREGVFEATEAGKVRLRR